MSVNASSQPVRLLVVALETERARSLATSIADELQTNQTPRLVGSVPEALFALRTEPCDAVIALHHVPQVDALVFARALRGAGDETPLAILGAERAIDAESVAWDVGADEYACLAEVTAGQLAGRLRRAIDARERLRESRRLLVADQQRLACEKSETEWILKEQQRLLNQLNNLPEGAENPASLRLVRSDHSAEAAFADLIRSAILEQETPGTKLSRVADDLAAESISGPRLFEMHLSVVNEAVEGLKPKAERLIRSSADRVLLEAVVHLAEAYRRRYAAVVEGSGGTGPVPAVARIQQAA